MMSKKYPLKFCVLTVFLCWFWSSSSQDIPYEKMLHLSYAERIYEIHSLYKNLLRLKDPEKIAKKTHEIREVALREGDEELVLEMDLFYAYYVGLKQNKYNESISRLSRLRKEAAERNNLPVQIRCYQITARIYWLILHNYEEGFKNLLAMSRLLDQTNIEEYPNIVQGNNRVGNAYFFFRDYPKAIYYYEKNLGVPETELNSLKLAVTYNNLGLCYQKLGKFEKSNYYLTKIAGLKEEGKEIWWAIAQGNMGYNFFLQKEYDKAIPLLRADLKNAEETQDYGRGGGALAPLADICIQKNQLDLAWQLIEKAENYICISGQMDRFRLLYPVMSKWYSATNQPRLANAYLDSTLLARKAYAEKYSALKALRAQQKIDDQELKLQIAQLGLEHQQKIAKSSRWIVLLLVLCSGIAILYFVKRKQSLQRNLELQAIELSLQKSTQKLEKAELKLENFVHRIVEKNRLFRKLKKVSENSVISPQLQKLQKSVILTNEHWEEFQKLFEEAYPGFFFRLKDKYPQLTPSLLRIIALTKLRLSTRKMADMLGVSINSVQVTRHRLYKKLDLDGKGLKDLVQKI